MLPGSLLSEQGNRLDILKWGTIEGDHTAQGTCIPACEFECTSVYMAHILTIPLLLACQAKAVTNIPPSSSTRKPHLLSLHSLIALVAPHSLPPTLGSIPARLCLQWKTLPKREGGTPSRKAFSPELLLDSGREQTARSFTGPASRHVSTTTCSRDIRHHQFPRALQRDRSTSKKMCLCALSNAGEVPEKVALEWNPAVFQEEGMG